MYNMSLIWKIHFLMLFLMWFNFLVCIQKVNDTRNSGRSIAVDACSMTSSLALYSNQTIVSFTSKYQITKEQHELVSSNVMVFEEWLRTNSHLIIKALFVFQVQPSIEPFMVHVFPSNNGKANEHFYLIKYQ